MPVPVVCVSHSRKARALRAGLVMVAPAALLLSVAAGTAEARVQLDQRLSLAPRFGIVVAGGAFGEYLDAGRSASLRLGYELMPGTSLYVEGGLESFPGREIQNQTVTAPDISVVRFVAGLERELIPPDLPAYEAWSLRLRGAAGVAKLESDKFRNVGGTEDMVFSSTSPTATFSVALGYTLGRVITLFAEGGLNWAPVEEDKTEDLAGLVPGFVDSSNSAFTFPYTLGLRLGL